MDGWMVELIHIYIWEQSFSNEENILRKGTHTAYMNRHTLRTVTRWEEGEEAKFNLTSTKFKVQSKVNTVRQSSRNEQICTDGIVKQQHVDGISMNTVQ